MSPSQLFYTRLSQASVALPIIAGLIHYKRLSPAFRIFFYFFFIAAGVEWASTNSLKIYHNENNRPIMHFYVLVEFLVFSTVYYLHNRKNGKAGLLIGINTLVGVAMVLLGLYKTGMWEFPFLGRGYCAASITVYALVYLFFLFKDIKQDGFRQPMFWVTIGALSYFGTNTIYFLYNSILLSQKAFIEMKLLLVHNALNIIAHCLYAQAFRCFRKTTTTLA